MCVCVCAWGVVVDLRDFARQDAAVLGAPAITMCNTARRCRARSAAVYHVTRPGRRGRLRVWWVLCHLVAASCIPVGAWLAHGIFRGRRAAVVLGCDFRCCQLSRASAWRWPFAAGLCHIPGGACGVHVTRANSAVSFGPAVLIWVKAQLQARFHESV